MNEKHNLVNVAVIPIASKASYSYYCVPGVAALSGIWKLLLKKPGSLP